MLRHPVSFCPISATQSRATTEIARFHQHSTAFQIPQKAKAAEARGLADIAVADARYAEAQDGPTAENARWLMQRSPWLRPGAM